MPQRPAAGAAAALLLGALLVATAACRRPTATGGADATPTAAGTSRFARIPKIDVHVHIGHPDALGRALALGDEWGVRHMVHVGAGPKPGHVEALLQAGRRTGGRLSVSYNVPWREASRGAGYGERMAAALTASKRAGAVGFKISKGLGLGYEGPTGAILPVDDPGLDVLFERAGALGMPISIHTGDPRAFWLPIGPGNERFDDSIVHPGWSYYGEAVPSWEALLAAFERRVARHPRTTFIGVHFGNAPEEPDLVARMLDKYPNYYIDTAARIPEIGRHDPARMRAFFIKYQDRILYGTDLGVGLDPDELMLGSTGEKPPTAAETRRFFESTWRYFETTDRDFEHPTPIQGRWRISGLGLPRDVLEKLYHRNAERLFGIPPVSW